jgi:predicted CxxxxCH...CXXCH cytochrome family protein
MDGSQVACGTCHAVPLPAPHVARTDCGTCHTGYTATAVNAATHIDGKVDVVPLTCSSCHGDATRVGLTGADVNVKAAPPVDSKGNAAVTARGVGVHLQHVNQATYRSAPIACSECHFNAVPTTTNHANGTVQFAFGALAKNASWGGVTPAPVWNGTTCAGTYCHGAFKNGANATTTWTQAGALGCSSCHGAPPGGNHPQNTNCGNCHGGYSSTTVNKANHMNGVLELEAMTCSSCHGKAGQPATASSPLNAAPPVDTSGLATGGIRIGAHASHLVGKTYSSGMACQNCHANVGTYTLTHSNGVIEVSFTNGTSASFRIGTSTPGSGTAAATCASTWCHAVKDRNGYSSGGNLPTPSWNGSITACTACHGVSPNTGHHQLSEHSGRACGVCHPGYATSATLNSTTVNKSLHVNGTRDVGGTGTSIQSWNPATRTCQPTCHGDETW